MKTCWMCKHFEYSEGSPGYGEYTPGYDFSMRCGKRHWEFDGQSTSKKEFAEYLTKANDCKDYEKCEDEQILYTCWLIKLPSPI